MDVFAKYFALCVVEQRSHEQLLVDKECHSDTHGRSLLGHQALLEGLGNNVLSIVVLLFYFLDIGPGLLEFLVLEELDKLVDVLLGVHHAILIRLINVIFAYYLFYYCLFLARMYYISIRCSPL